VKSLQRCLPVRLKMIALVVVSSVFLCTFSAQAVTPMPAFTLSDVRTGKAVSSEDFKGRAILVSFFATWCSPCLKEVPTFIQLQNEFGKEPFTVLALSVDRGGKGVVQTLIEKYSINYPVLMAGPATGRSFGGIMSIPASFLINKSGNVVKRYRPGYIPHSEFVNDIKRVLN